MHLYYISWFLIYTRGVSIHTRYRWMQLAVLTCNLLHLLLLLHIQVTHSHGYLCITNDLLAIRQETNYLFFLCFDSQARCVTDKHLFPFVFMLVWLLAGLFFLSTTTQDSHMHNLLLNNACPSACGSATLHTILYRGTFQRHRDSAMKQCSIIIHVEMQWKSENLDNFHWKRENRYLLSRQCIDVNPFRTSFLQEININ